MPATLANSPHHPAAEAKCKAQWSWQAPGHSIGHLAPLSVCCLLVAEEKHRRVPAGTLQQEKVLFVNSKQFGIHYSSSQTSKIWGRKFTGLYNIFFEAACHCHPNDREAVNIDILATDGKSLSLHIYPLESDLVIQTSYGAVSSFSSNSKCVLSLWSSFGQLLLQ